MRTKHIPGESAATFIIEHHEGACLRHAEAHRPRPPGPDHPRRAQTNAIHRRRGRAAGKILSTHFTHHGFRRRAGGSGTHRPRGADQSGDRRVYLSPGRISPARYRPYNEALCAESWDMSVRRTSSPSFWKDYDGWNTGDMTPPVSLWGPRGTDWTCAGRQASCATWKR